MAYPPGWPVMTQALIKRERWPGAYQGNSVPLVVAGQRVTPDQTVIRMEQSRHSGKPATATAQQAPELLPAGLYGRVVEITRRGGVMIESYATILQGTSGAGKQVVGILTMWLQSSLSGLAERNPRMIPPGAVLVVPGPINFALLRQAINSGVVGVVASSMTVGDLEGFLRTDMIQMLTGRGNEQAEPPPLTILLTEGVGSATMPARVLNLLNQYQGAIVLLSGRMSPQRHIFPELIISLPLKEAQQLNPPALSDTRLTKDALVRVCGGDSRGMIGVVDYLFAHQQLFASGIRAYAVRLRLEDGAILIVPVSLVERIG